jgi:hypothetical protein
VTEISPGFNIGRDRESSLTGQNRQGSFKWKIPASQEIGTYRIRLKGISNRSFQATSGRFRIVPGTQRNSKALRHPPAPVKSSAGPDQTEPQPTLIQLSGSNSIGLEKAGETASFHWAQLDGPPVELHDPESIETVFMPPRFGGRPASLAFELTVTDQDGLESRDTSLVNVTRGDNPPVCDAGPYQEVSGGDRVTLDGSGSHDSGGGIVVYSWKQLTGIPVILSDPLSVQPCFTAPEAGPGGASLVFRLLVTDPGGLRCRDFCTVNVLGINSPPVADAGSHQSCGPGDTVVLDGFGSRDADGGILTHEWAQISGRPVALSDPSGASPTFTAPDLRPGEESLNLVFRLTVTETGGLEHSDMVTVTVLAKDMP